MRELVIDGKKLSRKLSKAFIGQLIFVLILTIILTSQLCAIIILSSSYHSSKNSTSSIAITDKTGQTKLSDKSMVSEDKTTTDTENVTGTIAVDQCKTKEKICLSTNPKISDENDFYGAKRFPLISNPSSWPPVENRCYPDMELVNQDGTMTRLSNLAGKIIIVQHVAMNCPVSQALSGANDKNKKAFGLCFPTRTVKKFTNTLTEFTGLESRNSEIVFVQIIYYNMEGLSPSLNDAKEWAEHFNLKISNNQYVLVANKRMRGEKSKLLIPGFHLIDRAYVLRSDCAGPLAPRNIYNHFFPILSSLMPSTLNNAYNNTEASLQREG